MVQMLLSTNENQQARTFTLHACERYSACAWLHACMHAIPRCFKRMHTQHGTNMLNGSAAWLPKGCMRIHIMQCCELYLSFRVYAKSTHYYCAVPSPIGYISAVSSAYASYMPITFSLAYVPFSLIFVLVSLCCSS